MNTYDPAAEGWRPVRSAPLPGGLGIPWARRDRDEWVYGLLTTVDHANPGGIVHGGVLMAFADHALSFLAWEAAERAPCTTIQLNTHFLDSVRLGEFICLHGEVTRRTGGLVFVRGTATVQGAGDMRLIGAVDGIWRVLRAR